MPDVYFQPPRPPLSFREQFGVKSVGQVLDTIRTVVTARGRYSVALSSAGLLRPDLSFPAYRRRLPEDRVAPIFNLFDRTGGGAGFRATTSRDTCRDYRGGRLTYDEHDGTDFVCPPGTPLCAAAPGVVVAARDTFLRGGLTLCVDHGHGVVTQYTHLSRLVAAIGQSVCRGEVVALSGTAGFDMLTGFPWVPPHVHFMVWVRGRPVDPYRAPGEGDRPGLWYHGGDPETSGPLGGDGNPPSLASLAVDSLAIARLEGCCQDPAIRAELARAHSDAGRAAILEDSLHHDRPAWRGVDPDELRPPSDPGEVRLTLPLHRDLYARARPVDAPWTRPRLS